MKPLMNSKDDIFDLGIEDFGILELGSGIWESGFGIWDEAFGFWTLAEASLAPGEGRCAQRRCRWPLAHCRGRQPFLRAVLARSLRHMHLYA